MDATKVIIGAVTIIIGLVLLPLVAYFVALAKANASVSSVGGLTSVLDIILYGFCFGLVGVGIGMIYVGFRK